MKLNESTNDQLMIMAAHRYCLGRSSYIVGSCVESLMLCWGDVTPETRNVIVRDTIEALMDGLAGSPTIDAPRWRAFAEWAWGQMDSEARDWVRHAVAFKGKPWPLEVPRVI